MSAAATARASVGGVPLRSPRSPSRGSTGERLRRSDFFVAAFDLLAEGGVAALTTTNVCRRLGVTTGSLYHHFANGPAFYAAVIDHWENAVSPALRQLADDAGDPADRLDMLHQITLTGNHDTEKAIRAWASSDPMVAAAQQRVDAARERHLTDTYVAAGIPAERALVLARIGFAILIGNQQLGPRTDLARLADALAEYRQWVTAVALESAAASPQTRKARRREQR